LLIEQFDLRSRPLGELLFVVEGRLQTLDFGACRRGRTGVRFQRALQPALFRFRGGQRGAQRRDLILIVLPGRAFECQELRQLVDLRVQPVEHLVLARDFAAEQKLHQHKD